MGSLQGCCALPRPLCGSESCIAARASGGGVKGRTGGRGYAGSRMNAGPLSRNTLNCLVCEEVAGMVSMM